MPKKPKKPTKPSTFEEALRKLNLTSTHAVRIGTRVIGYIDMPDARKINKWLHQRKES